MTRVELLTSLEVFARLHALADGRAGSVKVNREELGRLLIDHSLMLDCLHKAGVKVVEPTPIDAHRHKRPSLAAGAAFK